ncbi:MAG: arginyltransferase [Thiohalospira sp.]
MTVDRRPLRFFRTPRQECPYLEEEVAVQRLVDPHRELDPPTYTALLAAGYRRSGCLVYRPDCPECSACRAARIPVADFCPTRGQRRTSRRNADLRVRLRPPRITAENFDLYRRYLAARHPAGGMDDPTPEQFLEFFTCHWCPTLFLELTDDVGRLLAVAVTDVLEDGLSAVYTFFEPDLPGRGLGVQAILSQIQLARARGLDWLYLGYWIPGSPKMAYKVDFRPVELQQGGEWQRWAERPTSRGR